MEARFSFQSSGRSTPQPHPEPALDFFSPSFDPLRALLTEGLLPPLPAARPLDAVYRCRFMLPPNHPEAWRDPGRALKSKEASQAAEREKSRLSYLHQKQERQQQKNNPLDDIAQGVRNGPLLLLKRCYQQRQRVKVVTRHARGVRGSSEGVLVAFDKHMNLVLRDVEERYTVLLRVQKVKPPAPGGNGREHVRWTRQQEHRQRQLKQVFIRGDSVVLVAAAAAAAARATAAGGAAAAAEAAGAAGGPSRRHAADLGRLAPAAAAAAGAAAVGAAARAAAGAAAVGAAARAAAGAAAFAR